MSEQYYYLLDGKENGPFSRAAMEGLLKSGKLNGAFVRSGSDQPWQLPEEVGYLGSEAQEPAAPSSTSTSPDPAALVFRSQRDIRKATRSGKSGTVVVVALLVGAAGAGVWWANQRGLMPDQLSNILPFIVADEGALDLSNGEIALKAGREIGEIPDGSYEFAISNPNFGGKPALEFRIDVRKPNATLLVKRHVQSERYIESVDWHEFKTKSGVRLGTVAGGHVEKNQCLTWKASTPTDDGKVEHFRQAVASTGADPDLVQWHRSTTTQFAICVAKEDASLPSSKAKLILLRYLNQAAPGTAPGADEESTSGEFSIRRGHLMGVVNERDVDIDTAWMGRITAVNRSRIAEPINTSTSVAESADSSPKTLEAAQVGPPSIERMQEPGRRNSVKTVGELDASKATEQNPLSDADISQISIRGRYRCFLSDTGRPGCSFEPRQEELEKLSKPLGFDAEEFSDIVLTNKSEVERLLAPHGPWTYGSCFAGGDANLQLGDLKARPEDGGVFVYARLLSYSYRTGPNVLPTEQQPEGCDPSISGLD